ncbi:GntR family transcriptional regulator [Brevibacterium daeguense]|uniref:GntR family transcriptional regulator n=1 Tax=Brevibacterium daeguense TaxID=909936 RepID=A0ABP8EI80_9MICO|nr:GntR family transcriptional regulator [Brevibacterium daeguense]
MRRFERGPSLREHALAEIRQAITVGELAEHTVYSAAGLAKQLGISLSPVREAMMSLVAEGTVEAVPNRGYRLVPVTEADLEEIVMIRVLLAVPAAERLAQSGTPEQLDQMRELADASLAAARRQDRAAFLLADRAFYEVLLRQGLGDRAAEISLQLRDQSRLSEVGDKSAAVNQRSAEEARELVDLIAAGDAEAAAELVRTNLYYFKRPEPAAASGGEESP